MDMTNEELFEKLKGAVEIGVYQGLADSFTNGDIDEYRRLINMHDRELTDPGLQEYIIS